MSCFKQRLLWSPWAPFLFLHGQVPLGDAAERMTVPIAFMLKFSNFELIFSGGEGRLVPTCLARWQSFRQKAAT
jgi:hypothetical protein